MRSHCSISAVRLFNLGGQGVQFVAEYSGNILGELLKAVKNDIALSSIVTSDIPILTECTAVIVTQKNIAERVNKIIHEQFNSLKTKYLHTDPDISLKTDFTQSCPAISNSDTQKTIDLLCLIKTAPLKMKLDYLITLSTLQKFSLKDGTFNLKFQVRFENLKDGDELFNLYKSQAKKLGFNAEVIDFYTAWSKRDNSPFRNKFINVHKKLFNFEPEFEHVLGGIEIAPIVEALPYMDAVGIAPTARGAHTSREHIILSETEDFWCWLLAVLGEKD